MIFKRVSKCLAVIVLLCLSTAALADKGTYVSRGGRLYTGISAGQFIAGRDISLPTSGATLNFACPVGTYSVSTYESTWTCARGTISVSGNPRMLAFSGSFASGSMTLTASGGGRGARLGYAYRFKGQFSGQVTVNQVTQSAHGAIDLTIDSSLTAGVSGLPITKGSFGWSSAYAPIFMGDNATGRVLASDSITGQSLQSYGSLGRGSGEFTTIAAITEDKAGRIYVVDSALDRVVRFDDMTGKNLVELGTYGSGTGHFHTPTGIAIDSVGNIWIADSGNDRIVRVQDMTGRGWTSLGTAGFGEKEFNNPTGIALDANNNIYIADTNNNRIVRVADITGRNWAVSTFVFAGSLIQLLIQPQAIVSDTSGHLYVALGGAHPALVQTNGVSVTGASASSLNSAITSLSLDRAGTLYAISNQASTLAQMNDALADGYFSVAVGGAGRNPGAVFARSARAPAPAATVLSAVQ